MQTLGQYPHKRMRRMRRDAFSRDLMRETLLTSADFIYPVFVLDGAKRTEDVKSMPGVQRKTLDLLLRDAELRLEAGGARQRDRREDDRGGEHGDDEEHEQRDPLLAGPPRQDAVEPEIGRLRRHVQKLCSARAAGTRASRGAGARALAAARGARQAPGDRPVNRARRAGRRAVPCRGRFRRGALAGTPSAGTGSFGR